MRNVLFGIFIVILAAALFAGCGEKRVQEFQEATARLSEDPHALDGVFQGEISFCRRVGKKSGKPIGKASEFVMGEKNSVHAVVNFKNAAPGELYAVHMVWLKPDDHEIFRRYAEVRVEESEDGYRSLIQWKKAEDLHYLNEKVQEGPEPAFRLTSRLRTFKSAKDEEGQSIKVPRDPGIYKLRVYLHRDLMLEESFELTL